MLWKQSKWIILWPYRWLEMICCWDHWWEQCCFTLWIRLISITINFCDCKVCMSLAASSLPGECFEVSALQDHFDADCQHSYLENEAVEENVGISARQPGIFLFHCGLRKSTLLETWSACLQLGIPQEKGKLVLAQWSTDCVRQQGKCGLVCQQQCAATLWIRLSQPKRFL